MSEQPISHRVGQRVYRKRKRLKMPMQSLADLAEVSIGTVHAVEKGGISPTLCTVERLAFALGTTVANLVK